MITIYTDGSCWPNPSENGGWGFVAYLDGEEFYASSGKAEGHTTNNRMEMTGMLRALEWLRDRPGEIHSDSQYVVNGMNSWCKAWERRDWMRKDKETKTLQPVVNADLWQRMVLARQKCHSIHWVRGHNGTAGNERADQLAEDARGGLTV